MICLCSNTGFARNYFAMNTCTLLFCFFCFLPLIFLVCCISLYLYVCMYCIFFATTTWWIKIYITLDIDPGMKKQKKSFFFRMWFLCIWRSLPRQEIFRLTLCKRVYVYCIYLLSVFTPLSDCLLLSIFLYFCIFVMLSSWWNKRIYKPMFI